MASKGHPQVTTDGRAEDEGPGRPPHKRANHQPWKPVCAPSAGNRPGTMLYKLGSRSQCSTDYRHTIRNRQEGEELTFFLIEGGIVHYQMIWGNNGLRKK